MDSLTTTESHQPAASDARAGAFATRLRIAMAVGWTLVILFLCWMPGGWVQKVEGDKPWLQLPNLDKLVHWGIFVAFTILWLRTGTSKARYTWVALGGLALTTISELVQELPAIGRDATVGDAIGDMIGVAIGLLVFRWVEPWLGRAEARLFRAANP